MQNGLFQLNPGFNPNRKTSKCVLPRVETAAKPTKKKVFSKVEKLFFSKVEKLKRKFQCKTTNFNLGWKFPP